MKKVSRKSSKLPLLLIIVLIILISGFWLLKKLMAPSQIALIDSGNSTCISNISSYITSGNCGGGLVERVDYICTTAGQKGYEGGAGNCVDPLLVFEHAQSFCGQTCTTVSVSPSPTPYPLASCVPNPCRDMATCKLMALPDGQSYCAMPVATSLPTTTTRPVVTPTTTSTPKATPKPPVVISLSPSPSPKIVSPRPQPVVTNRCIKFFGRSYCWNGKSWR